MPAPRTIEHFWDRAKFNPINQCLEWQYGLNSGYGYITWKQRNWLAHRFAYTIYFGSIVDELFVLHKCDNKLCINPAHLYLGDHQANMNDAIARGRFNPKGEGNKSAKITGEIVKEIRILRPHFTLRELGFKFKLTQTQLCGICKRRYWPHILDATKEEADLILTKYGLK
jgi:hypothetical protein